MKDPRRAQKESECLATTRLYLEQVLLELKPCGTNWVGSCCSSTNRRRSGGHPDGKMATALPVWFAKEKGGVYRFGRNSVHGNERRTARPWCNLMIEHALDVMKGHPRDFEGGARPYLRWESQLSIQ